MIAGLVMLIAGALLIAFAVWRRHLQRIYLEQLAKRVQYAGPATDPWEEPRIIATFGGIYDYEQDGSGL